VSNPILSYDDQSSLANFFRKIASLGDGPGSAPGRQEILEKILGVDIP